MSKQNQLKSQNQNDLSHRQALTHALYEISLKFSHAFDQTDLAQLAILDQVRPPIDDLKVGILLEDQVAVGGLEQVSSHDVLGDEAEAAVGVDELGVGSSLGMFLDGGPDRFRHFRIDQKGLFVIGAAAPVRLKIMASRLGHTKSTTSFLIFVEFKFKG